MGYCTYRYCGSVKLKTVNHTVYQSIALASLRVHHASLLYEVQRRQRKSMRGRGKHRRRKGSEEEKEEEGRKSQRDPKEAAILWLRIGDNLF